MSTAYNVRNKLGQSARAGRNVRLDPGSGGVISLGGLDLAVVSLDSTGARTLEDATSVGVGSRIICIATASSVTVNSVAVADGDFAEFVVVKNSSGVNAWEVSSSSAIVTGATTLAAAQASPVALTGDTSAYVEGVITGIIDALVAAGIVTDGTTTYAQLFPHTVTNLARPRLARFFHRKIVAWPH